MNPSFELYPAEITACKELLLDRCGLAFENGRETTLLSAVRRRMEFHFLDSPGTYHALLFRDDAEFQRLVELLTVNETYFRREEDHLRLFLDRLAPEMLERRAGERPVRIVSAGCSTGEEPYTIAIMLRERFGDESGRLFSLTGVDIDASAIVAARRGVYGKNSFRGDNGKNLRHYFEPYGRDQLRIAGEIACQVGFEVVNLLSPSYPPSMHGADVIFYRNVSIYFPEAVQRRVFAKLASLLADEGCLITGAGETIPHDVGILALTERDGLFFFRKSPAVPSGTVQNAGKATFRRQSRRRVFSFRPLPCSAGGAAGPAKPEKRAKPARIETVAAAPPAVFSGDAIEELFGKALELVTNGETGAALPLLDTIIGRWPAHAGAHTLMGGILVGQSRLDEAHTAAQRAFSLDSLRSEAIFILGIVAHRKDDDDEALKRFRQAIYLNSGCWPAHFHLAEMAFSRKEWKRALAAYSRTVEVLESGSCDAGLDVLLSAMAVRSDQFLAICRHKLNLLQLSPR